MKHFRVESYCLKEAVRRKTVQMDKVGTNESESDWLTKFVSKEVSDKMAKMESVNRQDDARMFD